MQKYGRIFCKFPKSTEDRKGDMQSLKLNRNLPQESLCARDKPWENEGLGSDYQLVKLFTGCKATAADVCKRTLLFTTFAFLPIAWHSIWLSSRVSGMKTVLQLQYCFRPASLFCLTLCLIWRVLQFTVRIQKRHVPSWKWELTPSL